jgi:hypothetical protein
LHELDVSANLLGVSQKSNQQTDSAGIDHGNFGEVKDEVCVSVVKGLLKGLAQTIHGGAHSERSPKLHDLHLRTFTDVYVQTVLRQDLAPPQVRESGDGE